MGWLNSDHVQGFLAHFSICVTSTETSPGLRAKFSHEGRAEASKPPPQRDVRDGSAAKRT